MNTMLQEKRPRPSPNRKKPRTRLEYVDPTAKSVCIAGTFNDWRPEATAMLQMGDGYWVKDLSLPPGNYEYRLVVDGKWIPDPLAGDHVPNPFGGINSVLIVPSRNSTSAPSPNRPPSLRRLEAVP